MPDFAEQLNAIMPTALSGSVVQTEGLMTSVAGFPAPVGALAEIERQAGDTIEGEVIGFRDGLTLVFPFQPLSGVRHGSKVRLKRTLRTLGVSDALLGRVVNARGQTTDQLPAPAITERIRLDPPPISAIERPPIDTPLGTGIRAIDGLLTCGRGQRIGIFAGSGVGKSVSLGMMAKYTAADVNVIALIGERGREVNEFLERDLGPAGRAKSVVVVATSDEPAILRVQAATTATALAEYFRDQGKDVLLLMDSITRLAMAQREIGLAAGEPPTTRGYPPSVFGLLPKLVERAGRTRSGSITGFYSVLVEGDDTNEPVSDTIRGLLDGHVILSRKLASQGHYPAVDVLPSISRLLPAVSSPDQQNAVSAVRNLLAAYREHEDLISIGAYRTGANPRVDAAIAMKDEIDRYLRQKTDEATTLDENRNSLAQLALKCHALANQPKPPAQPAATA